MYNNKKNISHSFLGKDRHLQKNGVVLFSKRRLKLKSMSMNFLPKLFLKWIIWAENRPSPTPAAVPSSDPSIFFSFLLTRSVFISSWPRIDLINVENFKRTGFGYNWKSVIFGIFFQKVAADNLGSLYLYVQIIRRKCNCLTIFSFYK